MHDNLQPRPQFDGVHGGDIVLEETVADSGDGPEPLSPNDELDAEFVSDVNGLLKDYITAMDAVKLRSGLQIVMHVSARGNLYLQSSGLNKALKAENPKRCAQVVVRAINLIYVLSTLVYPFMPSISESVLEQLNAPARAAPEVLSIDIFPGHQVGTPEHLFRKIDEKMIDVYKEKFAGNKPAPNGPDRMPRMLHLVLQRRRRVRNRLRIRRRSRRRWMN